MSLIRVDLMSWYRLTFLLKHKYGWSIAETEELYPFELEVYSNLLTEWLEMEKNLAEEKRNLAGAA